MQPKQQAPLNDVPEVMFGIGDRSPIFNAPYTGIHLDELQTPHNGYVCMMNRWWVTSSDHALFYDGVPQCNVNQRVAEYLADPIRFRELPTHVETQFIAVAYVRPRSD